MSASIASKSIGDSTSSSDLNLSQDPSSHGRYYYLSEADSQIFNEMKEKEAILVQELQRVKKAFAESKNEVLRGTLTLKEVARIPETTHAFRSVGRMYLAADLQGQTKEIKTRIEAIEAELPSYEEKTARLRKNLEDITTEMREMLESNIQEERQRGAREQGAADAVEL